MRIDGLSKSVEGQLARISAKITWEDCGRPSQEVSLSTLTDFSEDLSCHPHTFLLTAYIPAMLYGEKRLKIEGQVCPQLRNGLDTAQRILRHWFGDPGHGPIAIEPTQGFVPTRPLPTPRCASFMSGGVDALTTLRLNRQDFPTDHPASIGDGIRITGYGIPKSGVSVDIETGLKEEAAFLAKLSVHENLTIIPVQTNFSLLWENDHVRFAKEGGSAFLAAIAHAFSSRFSTVIISSGRHVSELAPVGNHPLLDPNYSSCALTVRHEGIRFTRFEKVGLLTDWELGLQCLQTCNFHRSFYPTGYLNCGECDKCIHTMIELLLCGKLDHCPTFPTNEITPEMVQNMKMMHYPFYLESMVEPLKRFGRTDLADPLQLKLEQYKEILSPTPHHSWRERIKEWDHHYTRGLLAKSYDFFKSHLNPSEKP